MFNAMWVNRLPLNINFDDYLEIGIIPIFEAPNLLLPIWFHLHISNYGSFIFPYEYLSQFLNVCLDDSHPDNDGNGIFSLNYLEYEFEPEEYFFSFNNKNKFEIKNAYISVDTVLFLYNMVSCIRASAETYWRVCLAN